MAIYPGAIYKPITAPKGRKAFNVINRVNLHVAVSEASSLHGYFNQRGIADSHFYVRKDGTVEQYVDTKYRAFADLEGNDATISIETQGGLTNANGEPWTSAQLETLAQLYAWAVKTHGIKLQLAKDSRLGDTSKGLSWHRLGVPGYMVAGGMRYSKAAYKACPGDKKISQIPGIFARAKEILNGTTTASKPKPTAPSKPAPSKPAPKPAAAKLKVDGVWGAGTTRRLQEVLGTVVDGEVSSQPKIWRSANTALGSGWEWVTTASGSRVIRALQTKLGVTADGKFGEKTIRALQKRMGTPVDGVLTRGKNGSPCVAELQRRLNAGKI